jgi:hypothetical protein
MGGDVGVHRLGQVATVSTNPGVRDIDAVLDQAVRESVRSGLLHHASVTVA